MIIFRFDLLNILHNPHSVINSDIKDLLIYKYKKAINLYINDKNKS